MDPLHDMLNPQNRMAAIAAEFDRRGTRITELEAEVARLSRRPDLSPEQCDGLESYLSERFPMVDGEYRSSDAAILEALRAAAAQEAGR